MQWFYNYLSSSEYYWYSRSTWEREIFFCLKFSSRIPSDSYGSDRCTQNRFFHSLRTLSI